ncbi:MAG: MerR family transcriptional regulator [Planctomycetes bacterium]|nr:MerR family transcriptional regulator [Planctomycetota bacterium]
MPAEKSKSQPRVLKISEVADRAKVSKQTVEYYVMLGLIQPQRNTQTGRRGFDDSHVKLIRLIRQLNRSGYTLREIRDIWLKKK